MQDFLPTAGSASSATPHYITPAIPPKKPSHRVFLLLRSAPKDAVTFNVQGTPGVKIYVVHDTQSVKLPSSVSRWPLAAGAEVLLAMDTISKDVGDEKVGVGVPGRVRPPLGAVTSAHSSFQVRISYYGEAGGVPVGRAMLYLTCVGK